MQIIEYTPEWKERWDDFVERSNNGTLFHMQRFFDYHPSGRFPFNHLIFLRKGKIEAVLPGSIVDGAYESPIGASYGSIVTKDLKFSRALEIVDALVDWCLERGLKKIMLTAAPMIYEQYQNQNLEFALRWRGFDYELHYISSAVKLDPGRDLLGRFQATTRRNIKNAMEDIDQRVEINEDYEGFYPILVDNKARHGVKPTHSLEDIHKLRELFPDRFTLLMLYLRDKPIAGSMLFKANEYVSLCFYIMMYYDYKKLHPVHRLMYESIKWSEKQGYEYFDIGVSQETKADDPMTPRLSLIEFKESFDAKTIMRNTLSKDL